MSKILLVEDIDEIRENTRELLEINGFDVIEGNNGYSALKLLETHSVDLILSDIVMPHMDGLQLLDYLKNVPRFQNIPFICMSASVQETEKALAFSKGIQDFITKPFTEDTLLSVIRKALD